MKVFRTTASYANYLWCRYLTAGHDHSHGQKEKHGEEGPFRERRQGEPEDEAGEQHDTS